MQPCVGVSELTKEHMLIKPFHARPPVNFWQKSTLTTRTNPRPEIDLTRVFEIARNRTHIHSSANSTEASVLHHPINGSWRDAQYVRGLRLIAALAIPIQHIIQSLPIHGNSPLIKKWQRHQFCINGAASVRFRLLSRINPHRDRAYPSSAPAHASQQTAQASPSTRRFPQWRCLHWRCSSRCMQFGIPLHPYRVRGQAGWP